MSEPARPPKPWSLFCSPRRPRPRKSSPRRETARLLAGPPRLALADYWQEALHSLKGLRHVVDIRNLGLVGAIELAPRTEAPAARAYDVFVDCFQKGLMIRVTGDIVALSPPLIIEKAEIEAIVSILGEALKRAE